MKKYVLVFFIVFLALPMRSLPVKAISAASYCLLETTADSILYAKNADVRRGMASTTKIMTAIVALESGKTGELATVSYNASRAEGSSLYLKPGEKICVLDLVYGMMLNSGNDAAIVLAEHIGGSVESFVTMMNEKAQSLGAVNTHFVNPNGLSDDNHYTTAADLARITAYALQNDAFKTIVATKSKAIETAEVPRTIYLSNHNKLLLRLDGCDGVKTGFTKATGRCLVSSVSRNGFQTVCVTLNAPDDWNDHATLHDLAFSEYALQTLLENGEAAGSIPVHGGVLPAVGCVAAETVQRLLKPDAQIETSVRYALQDSLTAPIVKGQKVGTATVYIGTDAVADVDVVAEKDVPAVRILVYKTVFATLLHRILCM